MRMGINDFSANDFISNMDENNLSRVLKYLVMKDIQKIAREIVRVREFKTIKTEDLVKLG